MRALFVVEPMALRKGAALITMLLACSGGLPALA